MAGRGEPIRGREIVGALLVYFAVALWWLWPLPTRLATDLPDLGHRSPLVLADLLLIIWALAWDCHALVTAPWNLFHANAFFPSTSSLAYSEHVLGYVPLFAPTYWISGNPVLAANVLILALPVLRGVSLYVLARLWVSAPAAGVAGLLHAFWPWAFADLMKFHVHGVLYLPLALYFTERWLERARTRDVVAAGTALFLQAATSVYLGFAAAFGYGAYLVVALAGSRRLLDRRRVVGLVLSGGVAAAGILLLGLPYLSLQSSGVVPSYDEEGVVATGLVPGIAAVALRRYFLGNGIDRIGLALVALAFLPPWRERLRPLLIGIVLLATGLMVSAGPDPLLFGVNVWSPYRLLMDWLPGFSSIRAPSRFIVVAHLGTCLLVALGIARVTRRLAAPLAWTGCAVLAVVLLALQPAHTLPLRPQPVGDAASRVHRWLAENGEERAVFELPPPTWPEAARRMLLSSAHWLPIVDGYSGYPLDTDDFLHGIARNLPEERSLQELVDHADIGWIVAHARELSPGQLNRWRGPLPDGLRLRAEIDGDLVYEVTRAPKNDRRSLLLSKTTTLEGRPRALLGASCPGEILLDDATPRTWHVRRAIPLMVRLRNDGTEPWPGAGLVPDRLVRARACFESPGEVHCQKPQRLSHDVPAGESVVSSLVLWTPRTSGDYTLRVELAQAGGKPLEECGVAPLRIPVKVVKPTRNPRNPARRSADEGRPGPSPSPRGRT